RTSAHVGRIAEDRSTIRATRAQLPLAEPVALTPEVPQVHLFVLLPGSAGNVDRDGTTMSRLLS
ncbi:MAG: hypothetical protein M3Q31_24715, partial [Actinomycetota bacterium]|nr:hypothetical protein [Actinomycetota bacterium]